MSHQSRPQDYDGADRPYVLAEQTFIPEVHPAPHYTTGSENIHRDSEPHISSSLGILSRIGSHNTAESDGTLMELGTGDVSEEMEEEVRVRLGLCRGVIGIKAGSTLVM